ncbi:MAG TPA: HAD family phosphatase [Anaerolineales bacterium]
MDPSKAIEAVIWDLGGVILRTEDRRLRAAWESRLNLAEGELDQLVFAGEMGRKAALGQAQAEDVWRWVGSRLKLSPEELERLESEFWQGDQLDGALVQFIRELRPEYHTALLSNAWPGMRQMIENEWGIADCFDDLFISAELGLAKPDPKIYRLALDRLDVPPPRAVFVDDFSENVKAAAALGLRAIQFLSSEQAMQSVNLQLGRTS